MNGAIHIIIANAAATANAVGVAHRHSSSLHPLIGLAVVMAAAAIVITIALVSRP